MDIGLKEVFHVCYMDIERWNSQLISVMYGNVILAIHSNNYYTNKFIIYNNIMDSREEEEETEEEETTETEAARGPDTYGSGV